MEALPKGWNGAVFTLRHSDGSKQRRIEIIDPKGDRYVYESMGKTARKCFGLLIGIPVYLAAYMAWQALRAPIAMVATVITSLSKLIAHPSKVTAKQFLKDLVWTVPKIFIQAIWAIVRAPFYAIAMQFAALIGIFKPIQWRVHVGAIERAWHQVPKEKDICTVDLEKNPSFLLKALGSADFSHTFYLAPCMQKRGNERSGHKLSAEHIEQNSIQILKAGDPIPQVDETQ